LVEDLKLSSVKRKTLSQQVSEQIIMLITEGRLKPGDRLPSELDLIDQFGVSRPVLREALSSLETLEILSRSPRGGTYINKRVGSSPYQAMLAISINNIPAVIEARMALELGLVTIAAEKITDTHLKQLEKSIEGIRKYAEQDYGKYDKEFHRIIAYSVDNPILEGMIESLLIAHNKTNSLIPFREPKKTINDHKAIYEALKKRDSAKAFKEMYKHLSYVQEKILKFSKEDIDH